MFRSSTSELQEGLFACLLAGFEPATSRLIGDNPLRAARDYILAEVTVIARAKRRQRTVCLRPGVCPQAFGKR